jgi:hypothetical protein
MSVPMMQFLGEKGVLAFCLKVLFKTRRKVGKKKILEKNSQITTLALRLSLLNGRFWEERGKARLGHTNPKR